ncbi:MAG TPA: hypothetical protein VJ792_02775 [Candidatus Nitrosotalea sp.]|nr:hypothetical protein [Candidatus Nitrosotalea sp.]
MPDESCRSCGGDLRIHSQCGECRKVTQKVCQACNALTRKQFHAECYRHEQVLNTKNECVLEVVQKKPTTKRYPLRPIAVSVGTACFLILYLTAATYPGLFQGHQPDTETVSPESIPTPQVKYDTVAQGLLQNCLAYGSGESVTVTCPTQYGYVYKAILDMPKGLAAKFSDSVFSIRGLSVTENTDGTVVLQYQNSNYVTKFFGV